MLIANIRDEKLDNFAYEIMGKDFSLGFNDPDEIEGMLHFGGADDAMVAAAMAIVMAVTVTKDYKTQRKLGLAFFELVLDYIPMPPTTRA